MTTPLERLTTAIGDRYRIERQLGAGSRVLSVQPAGIRQRQIEGGRR